MSDRPESLAGFDLQHWQRLSPWSILYFVVKGIRNLADPNMVLLLAPLYGVYQWMDNDRYFLILGALALPLLIVGAACFQYFFFFFRIEGTHFKIRQGVLFRRNVDVPLHRIQDVMVHKPFYFKPFDLVSATIDTAGSNENEAVLAAVPAGFASALRDWALSQESSDDSHRDDTANTNLERPQETLLKRSILDLVLHGIANNKIWIFLAAFLPLVDRILERRLKQFIDSHADDVTALTQASAVEVLGSIAGILLVFVLCLAVLSVIGSLLLYYGFEIRYHGDSLSRESGLLSKSQISLKIRRVQFIQIRQNPLDRIFKRFNLVYRQFDNIHEKGSKERTTFLVPSLEAPDLHLCIPLVYSALPWPGAEIDNGFSHISKRYILQVFLTRALPLAIIIALFARHLWGPEYLGSIFAVVVILALAVTGLRWYRWGYQTQGEYLLVRTGLIGKNYTLLPRYKIQQISLSQSLFMRHNYHCHLQFILGQAGLKIPYVPRSVAIALADQMLFDAEAGHQSWM